MTTGTYRIPDVSDLPAGLLDEWEDVDVDDPNHRLMVALHRHAHLVTVPEWDDLGAWAPTRGGRGWRIVSGLHTVAEAAPVSRFDPDGPWELYVEHDEWENVVAPSEADLRWLIGVLVVLDAAAPVTVRTCRVCGCTDVDCLGCIERTGAACSWVAHDLCSACVEVDG